MNVLFYRSDFEERRDIKKYRKRSRDNQRKMRILASLTASDRYKSSCFGNLAFLQSIPLMFVCSVLGNRPFSQF